MCGVKLEANIPHYRRYSVHITYMDRSAERYVKLLKEPYILVIREEVQPVVDVFSSVSSIMQRSMKRENDIRACFGVYLLAVDIKNSRSLDDQQQPVSRAVRTVYYKFFVMFMMISNAQAFHFSHLCTYSITLLIG